MFISVWDSFHAPFLKALKFLINAVLLWKIAYDVLVQEDRDETLITNTQRRGDESPNRVAAVATTAAAASVNGDEVDGAGALTSSSLAVAPPSYAYACATSTPRLHARREQPCQRLSHISDRQDDSISWRMNMNAIARDDDDEDSLPSS